MIIGLTGKNAAGKGEIAKYLQKKGFVYYSLSDMIRDEATKRGLEHSRDNMINLGNDLRQKFGPGCLAQKTNEKIENTKKKSFGEFFFVIDSIRSPHEVKELKKNKDFILVGIEAPIELRLERMLRRNRIGDAKTLEELKQHEQRENLKSDANQQVDVALKLANAVVINAGTLEDLHERIDYLLVKLRKKQDKSNIQNKNF